MGLKEFKIIFDDPERTYRPGETLKAQIIVVLDYPQKYRGKCFFSILLNNIFKIEKKSKSLLLF